MHSKEKRERRVCIYIKTLLVICSIIATQVHILWSFCVTHNVVEYAMVYCTPPVAPGGLTMYSCMSLRKSLLASPVVLSMWSSTRKFNMCRFDSGKWFWLRIIAQVALVKGSAALCTCSKKKKTCNKYDLTAAQYFWLVHHNDWSRWFVISNLFLLFTILRPFGTRESSTYFLSPVSVFNWWSCKRVHN